MKKLEFTIILEPDRMYGPGWENKIPEDYEVDDFRNVNVGDYYLATDYIATKAIFSSEKLIRIILKKKAGRRFIMKLVHQPLSCEYMAGIHIYTDAGSKFKIEKEL